MKKTLPYLALGFLAIASSSIADHHEEAAEPDATPAKAETADPNAINFATQVYPILEAKCVKCHEQPYEKKPRKEGAKGRTKKPKSKYRMDGKKFLLAGGTITAKVIAGTEEGISALTPGDASKSSMYTYTNLPEEDELHMPTKGDDLTPEEKEILKNWINQGANFGEWIGNEDESIRPYDPDAPAKS